MTEIAYWLLENRRSINLDSLLLAERRRIYTADVLSTSRIFQPTDFFAAVVMFSFVSLELPTTWHIIQLKYVAPCMKYVDVDFQVFNYPLVE